VHVEVVAAYAQRSVVAGCGVGDVQVVTVLNPNRRHRNPAKQEDIEPDVEDEDHVVVGVASSNTVVDPDAVGFVAISALVARLAMLRPGWLDHFAVRAQLRAGQLFKELTELKQVLLLGVFYRGLSFDVTWIRFHSEVPD